MSPPSARDDEIPTEPLQRRDSSVLRRLGDLEIPPLSDVPSPPEGGVDPMPSPGELPFASVVDMKVNVPGYQIVGMLGAGGMGVVYEAVQLSLNRKVAVKVLSREQTGNAEFEARFKREAQVMAAISHPNIVTVFDSGCTPDGLYYYSMEKVEGNDLHRLLYHDHLTQDEAVELVLQICEALEHAHRQNLVHRDIKPSNIFVTKDGVAKIGDFGLVRGFAENSEEVVGRMHQSPLTLTGYTPGTPGYMAPECHASDRAPDRRSDIYSLGALFYEVLTGERPVGAWRSPSKTRKGVSRVLDPVVEAALEPNPDSRTTTVAQFRDELRSAIETPGDRRRKRRTLLVTAAMVAIGALLSTLLSSLLGSSPQGEGIGIGAAPSSWTMQTNVLDALLALGEPEPDFLIRTTDPNTTAALAETGRQLVTLGFAELPDGGNSALLSNYFRCNDCHNTVREYPDPANISDPVAALAYSVEHDVPLLQGTTFAGMVNRERWYNGDYEKKYRFSLEVRAARNDLRKATILCCRECSQGRDPEAWELEAMLAYFLTLQWKFADLDITDTILADWKRRAARRDNHSGLVSEIKSHYALEAPATFGEMPKEKTGFVLADGEVADPEIGGQVFRQSCLHCHNPVDGVAEETYRDTPEDRARIARKFGSLSSKSAYGLIRLGTHPETEKRPYMPNYTKEKLSDFQIESLKAYLRDDS